MKGRKLCGKRGVSIEETTRVDAVKRLTIASYQRKQRSTEEERKER